MSLPRYSLSLLVLLTISWSVPSAAAAQARAGVGILVSSGDRIADRASLPDDVAERVGEATGLAHPSVGFKYEYVSLFYVLDIWTSNGEYVLYRGVQYQPISDDEVLEYTGQSVDELGLPLGYRIPNVWWAGLALLAFYVLRRRRRRRLLAEVEESQRRYFKSKET